MGRVPSGKHLRPLPCLVLLVACALPAATVAGPVPRADASEKRFSGYMKKHKIAKVCADAVMDTDGNAVISRSSGHAETDERLLELLRGNGTVATMARTAAAGRAGKVIVPLEFDDTQFRPDGAQYCYLEPGAGPEG
jgi:hypothetical protein